MKKFLIALLTTVALSPALAWDIPAMNKQVDETNFLVNNNCSGTLIDADRGYILTANHCIEGQFAVVQRQTVKEDGTVDTKMVRVSVPGTVSQLYFNGPNVTQKNSYTFKIVKNDEKLDLALIQTLSKVPAKSAAKVACRFPVRGEPAYAVGNPLGVLYSTVSSGIIASVNRSYSMIGIPDHDELGLTQSTTPIGGGSSGGALYNDVGELEGVVVRGYQQIAPVALSVPLSDVHDFLHDVEGYHDCQ